MKNLRVSMKLIISFLIVVVFAIAVGLIGILGMNSINTADDALYNENVVALSDMGDIRANLMEQCVLLRNFVLHAEDNDRIQAYNREMTRLESEMETWFASYEETIVDVADEVAYFAAKDDYHKIFAEQKRKTREASMISFEGGYQQLYDASSMEATDRMVDAFKESMRNNDTWAKEQVDENTTLFTSMLILEIVLLAAAVAVALLFAYYISSLISKPLVPLSNYMRRAGEKGDIVFNQLELDAIAKYSSQKDEIGVCIVAIDLFIQHITHIANQLQTAADGDLTVNVEVLSEKDVLGVSLQKMADNLNNMFADIQSSSTQVSTGSKQVADGAQSLAQGSTEQAASIEELSSSISEIAQRTKTSAKTADKTAKLSETIKSNAEKGSQQMSEMIAAVDQINDASKSISKIIKTIDDIAFQTNILALNAAVEAARAGQHGKGFAVVAEEVRNLASKSADAAKETGVMIQNSMDRAELGTRIAGETAASLAEIVTGINESTQLIAEIAHSSEAQSHGIAQINTGIDQVAQVVQQNSATAEESAAASEEMSGQSDVLQQLISQFKLRGGGSAFGSLPPAARITQKRTSTPASTAHPNPDSGNFGKY